MFSANLGAVIGSTSPSSYWVNKFNNNNGTGASVSIATDASNNVFANLANAGGTGVSNTVKYNSSGSIQFQRAISIENLMNCALDSSGNIYGVCGYAYAGFVKLSSSGAMSFSQTFSLAAAGGGGTFDANGVCVDAAGAVLVGLTDAATNTAYLIKTTAAGAITWQRSIQVSAGASPSECAGVASDSSNNAYVSIVDPTNNNIRLAKFNSTGTLQWQKDISVLATVNFSRMRTDSAGNIYLTGIDSSVVKLNTSGVLQWRRNFSVGNIVSCAVNNSTGDVYAVGYASISLAQRAVVAKFNSTGAFQWAVHITDSAAATGTYGGDVCLDAAGNVIVALWSVTSPTNSIDFVKLDPSGSKVGTYGTFTITSYSPTITSTAVTVAAGTCTIATSAGSFAAAGITSSASSVTNTFTAIP